MTARGSVCVAVMARAPSAAGKSRLSSAVEAPALIALRTAMLADAVGAVSAAGLNAVVFCTPDEACAEVAALVNAPVIPQGDGDLGARMQRAIEHLLDGQRCAAALVIGSDIPHIDPAVLREAAESACGGAIVVGPADDGGYYLIGMNRLVPALFEPMEWGSPAVLAETLRRAHDCGDRVERVAGTFDIDTPADLRRLARELDGFPDDIAPHVRVWLARR